MPQGITPQAASRPSTCLNHSWELGMDRIPRSSKIVGIEIDSRYSIHCPSCNQVATKLLSELCPRCFTTMEHKRVDTEVSRFKHHPDTNLDPYHYATIHTCPTCTFRCVSFTEDH